MKPEKPITRKEMYLDVATGGSTELPSPVTREEKYLAKMAGESVDIPTPVTRYEMLLAAVAGESYTLTPVTRLEIYLAKAAGQDVEIPQPVTREEMYWFDYCGGTPTPPEREYTGAVPVTFVADGTPLLDYLISGNTVQSGTPTPDNPIMPQGTGERTGNLFDIPDIVSTGYYVVDTDKLYSAITSLKAEQYYTLSWDYLSNGTTGIRNQLRLRNGSGTIKTIQSGESFTLTQSDISNATDIVAYFGSNATGGSMKHFMLNEGSTALPYEPYGYKIPISSANTTTPVYLGEVQTTRKIRKLVFNGTEPWVLSGNIVYINNTDTMKLSPLICTHFPNVQNTGMWNGNNWVFQVDISNLGMSGRDAWITYLQQQYAAGTPVTAWYVLATEETAVVNEPLMKIGDYADTLSMEQAGVQIPTANGSTTLDVETTVPPSEVYIKYHGEAVATLSALPAEVSNPEETAEEKNPEEMEETENGSEDVSLQHEFEAIE